LGGNSMTQVRRRPFRAAPIVRCEGDRDLIVSCVYVARES
jgi:hypothetical protein